MQTVFLIRVNETYAKEYEYLRTICQKLRNIGFYISVEQADVDMVEYLRGGEIYVSDKFLDEDELLLYLDTDLGGCSSHGCDGCSGC